MNKSWDRIYQTFVISFVLASIDAMERNITEIARRHVRSLSYPEESEMGIFFALAIPLDDPITTYSMSVAFFFEANYKLPTKEDTNLLDVKEEENKNERERRSIDRSTVYSMLESKFKSIGYPARQCLLRSICETTKLAWKLNAGVLGDILRILFTPSSSRLEVDLHGEYVDAEKVDSSRECSEIYSTCKSHFRVTCANVIPLCR
ncbi:PREDICTED: uncharacterized protein LOC106787265 [Polistes canadensis]|uniref:uncharacterized protein LOC106787265 n=1 Tax=Polistes canadensis TaxID=91411 RepID=UPI000718DC23|nr:PREDICTED: uncharacterized protein LOC106787265 [Polistes canadensis]